MKQGPGAKSSSRKPWVEGARSYLAVALALAVLKRAGADTPETKSFPVSIRVDAAAPKGELKPIWRFFGADEPNYAYMTNGQTFFVVWCLSVIWFTGWVFNKGRVVNWFRVPCALPEATHVHVRAPAAVVDEDEGSLSPPPPSPSAPSRRRSSGTGCPKTRTSPG